MRKFIQNYVKMNYKLVNRQHYGLFFTLINKKCI